MKSGIKFIKGIADKHYALAVTPEVRMAIAYATD